MTEEEIQDLQELKKIYIKNLQILRKKEAMFSVDVPLHVVHEIHEAEEKLREINRKLEGQVSSQSELTTFNISNINQKLVLTDHNDKYGR